VSNVSKRPRLEDRRVTRRTEDMARDLELLAQRLAESREAIVRLLAAEADENEAQTQEPPVGPRLLRGPLKTSASDTAPQLVPAQAAGDGAPVVETSTANTGDAVANDAGASDAGVIDAGFGNPNATDAGANNADNGEDEPAGAVAGAEPGAVAGAARRRLMAVVLVAIGAVILLTALVSLL